MARVIEFPAEKDNNSSETEIKLGGHQASTADIIKRGQAVLARLECNLTWEAEWRDLILALGSGRDLALRTAETDKPQGPKYRKAMGAWLCCYGFDRIDGGDRSRLIQCYDHLDEINAWRSALPAEKQKKLNHPGTVLTHWKRSLRCPPPPPSIPPITIDMVFAWAATAAHEDKCRVAAALRIDVGAEVVKRAVAQERSSAQKQARKFIEGLRLALLTNEAPARQVEAVKAMVDAYDARETRTPDWRDRMDRVASSFTEGRSKQTVSTMLAPPPTKH